MAYLQDEAADTVVATPCPPPARSATPSVPPWQTGHSAGTDGSAPSPEPGPGPQENRAAVPAADGDWRARAQVFLAAHPVADGYNALPWKLRSLAWYDLELGEAGLDTDVPRLEAGGVGAQFWSLHTEEGCTTSETLDQIDRIKGLARAYPESMRIALGAGDVLDARSCGRIASLLGPAAAAALGDSLGTLRALHALGVRIVTLSGTSWTEAADGRGLTRFGHEVVREMNRIGMLPDLSGASSATVRATLGTSKAPVIFTRSAALSLTDHPDNLDDELLLSLRDGRGLCMVPFAADRTGGRLEDVADHLDHVRKLAGPRSVGLSGTYSTGDAHAEELADASCYPELIAELMRRGWSQTDLSLLTWENVQRVLRETEFAARAAQHRRAPSTARLEDLDH